MQRGLLPDAIARERVAVLQLLPGKDEALLGRRGADFDLDLCLYAVEGVRRRDVQRDGLPRERLYEDLDNLLEFYR